jgi:hypothetical protein
MDWEGGKENGREEGSSGVVYEKRACCQRKAASCENTQHQEEVSWKVYKCVFLLVSARSHSPVHEKTRPLIGILTYICMDTDRRSLHILRLRGGAVAFRRREVQGEDSENPGEAVSCCGLGMPMRAHRMSCVSIMDPRYANAFLRMMASWLAGTCVRAFVLVCSCASNGRVLWQLCACACLRERV